uniref:Centrosome and spindle pole-associated protein 1 C-terminal domain-containing protein n=2 Tax=Anabas testudineus TaxID=64144 RepID=A0AAQ6IQL2_ANATE
MQIESGTDHGNNDVNMPSASAAQRMITDPNGGLGLSLLLGADYDKKKQKLQQELQLDYKQYVAKKMEHKTSEARSQPQGLSLPIYDKLSIKEKLRDERNKEYNIFLQNKAQITRLKRGTPLEMAEVQASDASLTSPLSILNTHTNMPPIHRERPQKRDAATLTEAVDNGKSMKTWDAGHQRRRRWQLYNPKEPFASEEEIITDNDEELNFRQRWIKDRHTPEPESSEEWRTREHKANSLQIPDNMRATTRSRPATSKDKAEFATGLLIGRTEEQTVSQMRKEMYKQELLKQIAEQRKNKIREKKLELRVAATGATDPEKEPDRIKQFGAEKQQHDSWRRDISSKPGIDLKAIGKTPNPRREYSKPIEETEHGGPQGRSQVISGTALSQLTGKIVRGPGAVAPQGVPSLDFLTEDYHRDFSNMLGEMAIPRVASFPPSVPPGVTNNYITPFDAAYYYYGTRNPLEPHLPNYQSDLSTRAQQSGNFYSPPQRPPPLRTSDHTEATDQHTASSLDVGKALADKSKQRRESVLSYQEALRRQIKEREEHNRREKEEKTQYDAKIEAEMMAYNPWGRSGGGAPIKDQKGNLFSDLNQMHKINEESYRNPVVNSSDTRTPRSHRQSGFSDLPTPQQLDMQERYKEALKQQIEENKRKQAEEKEQMRIEEEKEEKRLMEQRARIQREYEEEQRKQKKIEQRLENQGWIREPKTHRQEEEKRTRQEQEVEKTIPESPKDIEEKKATQSYKREPSPPIPTLLKKQTNPVVSRPSSVASQLSTRTERSVSAPRHRQTPAKILQDGHQEVIRELSALRWYLRKEKNQMEAQLGKTDQQESHYTPPNRRRGRPKMDDSQSVHKQTDQPSTRRLYSGTAHVNMQNIREFNQLKNRDTASREEVLHMYPDPPTDAPSLDIQQQVLLREQQRQIRRMKKEEEHDLSSQHLSHY